MAALEAWFEANVFTPLRSAEDGKQAIAAVLDRLTETYQPGQRVCLFGMLALGGAREDFAQSIAGYFHKWIDALREALERAGFDDAAALSRETIARIQGAIVLARAVDDTQIFAEAVVSIRKRLAL